MRKVFAAFALIGFLCGPAAAENREAEVFQPALFVARDADSTLYLFGTVHVRRPGGAWGGPNALAALEEADEVWTEMPIQSEDRSQAQALVMQFGMAPPDRPLSSYFSTEENARLAVVAKRLGLQVSALERMRPWLAALTLSFVPVTQSGFVAEAGIDRAVVANAGDARLRAFETAEQQIGFFANLSDEAQRQLLLDSISGHSSGGDSGSGGGGVIEGLSDAWEAGDLAELERQVVAGFRDEYPELHEVIFTQRNHAWTEILVREMEGAGVDFVAVGAGHLLGEDGLVALLRARGIQVERVAP